jgi:hypothetical protein
VSDTKLTFQEREAKWTEYKAARKAFDESNNFYPCIPMDKFLAQPRPPVVAYCPGFVFADCMTIMAADPKEGKSTMFFHIVEAISKGGKFLGKDCEQAKVLYISEQNDGSLYEQTSKIEKLKTAESVFVLPIDYNRRKIPVMVKNEHGRDTDQQAFDADGVLAFREVPISSWSEQVKFWGEMLLKTGARVIVVDTLISFSQLQNGESYDAGEMTALLTALKTLYSQVPGLAIAVLCHCRKLHGTAKIRRFADIAGSYAIRAVSDMNVLLFAENIETSPRERTYVVEGRFVEHTTPKDGIQVALSEDWNTYELSTPIFRPPEPMDLLEAAFQANPELATLGRDTIAQQVGVTPYYARLWLLSRAGETGV